MFSVIFFFQFQICQQRVLHLTLKLETQSVLSRLLLFQHTNGDRLLTLALVLLKVRALTDIYLIIYIRHENSCLM